MLNPAYTIERHTLTHMATAKAKLRTTTTNNAEEELLRWGHAGRAKLSGRSTLGAQAGSPTNAAHRRRTGKVVGPKLTHTRDRRTNTHCTPPRHAIAETTIRGCHWRRPLARCMGRTKSRGSQTRYKLCQREHAEEPPPLHTLQRAAHHELQDGVFKKITTPKRRHRPILGSWVFTRSA